MVYLSTVLSALGLLLLGTTVSALPQAGPPPPPTQEQLDQIKMVFPPLPPSQLPVLGAPDNSSLLVVAPQLQTIVDNALSSAAPSNQSLTKRDECQPPQPNPFGGSERNFIWSNYADQWCDFYMPGTAVFYISNMSPCLIGVIPKTPPIITATLTYSFCPRKCGTWVSFVPMTNALCKARWQGLINHDLAVPNCNKFNLWLSNGDNGNVPTDGADWKFLGS